MGHRGYRPPATDAVEDNVKRLIAFVSLFAVGFLAACSPVGDGTRESCVGPYTGTFEVDTRDFGPVEGRILANFAAPNVRTEEPQLDLDLIFDTDPADQIIPMGLLFDVSDAGELTQREGTLVWVGTFNFDDCEASGTFAAEPFYTDGTWRLTTEH